jgi:hypothetical protein
MARTKHTERKPISGSKKVAAKFNKGKAVEGEKVKRGPGRGRPRADGKKLKKRRQESFSVSSLEV